MQCVWKVAGKEVRLLQAGKVLAICVCKVGWLQVAGCRFIG